MDAPGTFSVTAIIAAYNEEDIIGLSIQHLIEQGVSVYLIDHSSTDGTVAEAQRFAGKGLIGIERFPDESGFPAEDAQRLVWAHILQRKQKLAQKLDGDWFIHHDADEFRESPWPHLDLCQAIRAVHAAGYNAIDFAGFNFPPTDDSYRKGDDLRTTFRYCEPSRGFDRLRINAWKRAPVDLLSSGGHEAIVPERRVFPIRFLLRHYPIRNQAQGERKVLQERQPRWDPTERERGWHVQYDGVEAGHRFIRDPVTLTAYDPDATRLQLFLRHRGVEELESALAVSEHDLESVQRGKATHTEELERLRREQIAASRETEQAQAERDALARTLVEVGAQRDALTRMLDSVEGDQGALALTLDEVEGERDTLARTVDNMQAQRDSLAQTLDEVRAQHDTLARALVEVRAQRDALLRTLDQVHAERNSLASALDEARAQRDSLAHTLDEAQAQHDSLAHANDELGADLTRLQARIDELLASWSWRATGPARDLLRRLRGTR
ncbi:MAG TPA: glycosyltransferase family 2 protein [Polyangia bacterium]|jgi:Chromosome segregation ATPases|nr:glycosyltransferase family 2 protein [Polyangia bacterium]